MPTPEHEKPATEAPAWLNMIVGGSPGATYSLDLSRETKIGRGHDCQIMLHDPRCSRVHSIIIHDSDGWWVRDAGSTNGTFVNEQKIDEARLNDGCMLRVGGSEFSFHETGAKANTGGTDTSIAPPEQTVVREAQIRASDTDQFVQKAVSGVARGTDLLALHSLSFQLIGCGDPDEVVRLTLNALLERTKAALVGYLWVSDEGRLKPKMIVPQQAEQELQLSDWLTEKVVRKLRAVWLDLQTEGRPSDSLLHYADVICVPIHHEAVALGALHIYLKHGHFQQSEFEFAISVANLLGAALARTRRQAVLAADNKRLVARSGLMDELLGDCKLMLDLKSKIARVARASGCVLVRGESGAGKELVARAIHKASARSDRPMLAVNCAAIPRDLVESHLFGHKKGAFTGAESDHVGWFQQADASTLFLDEVGELPLEGQAKLLRILEGHPFLPVGGTKEVSCDVRVIAATNRDLSDFVRDGKFREDLYYRLSVFELHLPALRDRGTDIEKLVDHFLNHFKLQHGRPNLSLAPAARQKLLAYHWPGNIRQLRNVIDSAVVMAESDQVQPSDLGLRDAGIEQLDTLDMQYWERKLIGEALTRTNNNVPEAAKLLGIGRATLYRKIEEYNIPR